MDVAVEFGSLSKIFNMTGWRIGWAVGSPVAIEALGRVKTNIDSGIFNAVQRAGVAALESGMPHLPGLLETYHVAATDHGGVLGRRLEGRRPQGRPVRLAAHPAGGVERRLHRPAAGRGRRGRRPRHGYGPSGEGYIRLSITIPDDRLDEGCERVRKALVGR